MFLGTKSGLARPDVSVAELVLHNIGGHVVCASRMGRYELSHDGLHCHQVLLTYKLPVVTAVRFY